MVHNLPLAGTGSQNKTSSQGYHVYLIKVTAMHSLPSLVIRIRDAHRYTESRPALTGKCGCTDKPGSVAPDQLVMKHVSNSKHKYQVQHV